MESKLQDVYPFNEGSNVKGSVILCLDTSSENQLSNGEFTWMYLLMKLLRENVRVYLISCNHPRLHYESVMRQNVSSHITSKPHTFYPHFRVWT